MVWLPYRKYVVNSPLSSLQLRHKFENALGNNIPGTEIRNVLFTNASDTRRFDAHFFNDYVKLKEHEDVVVGGYHNFFRPEAKISYKDTPEGSANTVIIHPNLAVIIFILLMVTYVFYAATTLIIDVINGAEFHLFPMMMLLFPLLMFFVITSAFNNDLPQLELFIDGLLEA